MVALGLMQVEGFTATESLRADIGFMELALAAASHAGEIGEVPIGAVVVFRGEIVARAHNAPIAFSDPTAHAEILALREASRRVHNYRLPGATLYVTVEPCVMCVGAIVQARLARVVFGCADPKAGALGSVYDLVACRRTNHRFHVTKGICAEEAKRLLQGFFQSRRGA